MIYVLPGMGATPAMCRGSWRRLADCRFPAWPRLAGETTLTQIAERLVGDIGICEGDLLVGASLGGMIAGELAQLLSAGQVVLVGSAASRQEINPWLLRAVPGLRLMPLRLISRIAGWLPNRRCCMFAATDPGFVRATCRALTNWPGLKLPEHRLLRIHGGRDQVIPVPGTGVDCLIPDAGHLVAMTHADACVRFLLERTSARLQD